MAKRELTAVDCGDVGFIYSKVLRVTPHHESPLGTTAATVLPQVHCNRTQLACDRHGA